MAVEIHSDAYYRALVAAADELGANAADLLLVLWLESSVLQRAAYRDRSPQAKNSDGTWKRPDPEDPTRPYPDAVGQNQITRPNWQAMGETDEAKRRALLRLSEIDGLRYVVRSLKAAAGKQAYVSATMLYLANFAPAYLVGKYGAAEVHRDPGQILYSDTRSPEAVRQNAGLNLVAGDGGITIGDLHLALAKRASDAGYLAHLSRLKAATGRMDWAPSVYPRDGALATTVGPPKSRGFALLGLLAIVSAGAVVGTAIAWWGMK